MRKLVKSKSKKKNKKPSHLPKHLILTPSSVNCTDTINNNSSDQFHLNNLSSFLLSLLPKLNSSNKR